MFTRRSHSRARMALLVATASMISGIAATFIPVAYGQTVGLASTPPNQTQAVPPNIVVTFDDSGSMASDYMGDTPPFGTSKAWTSGPWYCAGVIDAAATSGLGTHAMNGVYYNPNVTYSPPLYADGTSFTAADATLKNVINDGVSAQRKLSPTGASTTTNFKSGSAWKCSYDSGRRNGTSPVSSGPYYYRYTGTYVLDANGNPNAATITKLYTASNWVAVQVPSSQYQNWANWYSFYRTRNQMARTALSRVFSSTTLASTTADKGFGSSLRVAWQNINDSTFMLPSNTIISALIDTKTCAANLPTSLTADVQVTNSTTTTGPICYRTDFFNWIFQVGANGSTPTRSATQRAGDFFIRSGTNDPNSTPATDLHDPYWNPPSTGTGDGSELSCRQNFHILMTDGLWNGDGDGPKYANLTRPDNVGTLPDGVTFPGTSSAGVTSIYAPQHDAGDTGYASLSDVAFHYWATDLRPDLYIPGSGKFVTPYLPDQTTTVFNVNTVTSASKLSQSRVNQEIYFNPANDPASWPHMSEYLIGLGVSGVLNLSTNLDCTDTSGAAQDACNLRKGLTNSSGSVGWPAPNGKSSGIAANIDDTWHAALAGRGQFFSAGNPQQLVDQLSTVLSSITARASTPTVAAVNASVVTAGALTFNTGYNSVDWSGVLQAVALNTDGSAGTTYWDAGAILSNATETPPDNRLILTSYMDSTGKIQGAKFKSDTAFDTSETTGLMTPASVGTNDTQDNRIAYLRGARDQETSTGVFRVRSSLLGAILDAQPVYVSYPNSGYSNNWPANSPEIANGAETYDDFVTNNQYRPATVYMAANDGMVHAFDATLTCTAKNAAGNCISFGSTPSTTAGQERWAYVPRAVYGNLGSLTVRKNFQFEQTVNATPVTRDVFFSDQKWHTILVGGLRLGGRGVYALDITDPTAASESSVLWEFDASSTATDASSRLGYTYGQPNIGRLKSGKWVVLVPSGYFPDCSAPNHDANCSTIKTQGAVSSLFILDAETGALIKEIQTTSGVTSYGLTSPVLGDYQSDQIDDVAYAGDLVGNLWRFDLSDASSDNWSVSQVFTPDTNGTQPITVMPRLFPDPATNRFIVVFGTGQYLSGSDNTNSSEPTQSVYGIRDLLDSSGKPVNVTRASLTSQTLTETYISDTNDPNYGATLRSLTTNAVPPSSDGWYFDLNTKNGDTASGERVVVTPGALFNSNTAIISTLIPGSNDPCNPSVLGSIMFVDATTGGAGQGVSALGGSPYVGARVNNVRTSGTVPVTTVVGGGKSILPGVTLTGKANNPGTSFTGDAPIWRRRSWSEINKP
jgi:type IV pilus assembly protein PilY1